MAGEKYIALEETSQAIKEAVEGVKTDVSGVKTDVGNVDTNVDGVKTDTEGIVLSNTSIKAIVDEIQNRIGLTSDTGGSDTSGSIMSKLNQLIKSSKTSSDISTTGEGNILATLTTKLQSGDYILYAGMVTVGGIYKIKINQLEEDWGYGVIQYSTEDPSSDKFLKIVNSAVGTDITKLKPGIPKNTFTSNLSYCIFVPKNSYLLVFLNGTASSTQQFTFTLTYGNS